MRYLITGGCGFVGTNLGARILAGGHGLVVFDNLSRHGAGLNLEWLKNRGECQFVHGDIRSSEDVLCAVQQAAPEVVFHLAGQVAMTTSVQRPRLDFETNALGTLNLLEAVRLRAPEAAVLFSSTNKVYGDLSACLCRELEQRYVLTDYPHGVPETMPLEFHSPYGCSKGSAEQYVLDYSRIYGLRTAVFRHSSMYGGRQFTTEDQGWVGWFVRQALEQSLGSRREFTVSGNGKQVRDLLHADDVAELYLLAGTGIDSIRGQAFNIGGGPENSFSILELLAELGRMLRVDLRFRHIPERKSDQKVFVADIRKVQAALPWKPRVGKIEGLREMIEWTRSCMPNSQAKATHST
jgi:CDP-paratose 2-epimerase